jgi:excisionase family DNA binding protein
MLSLDNYSEGNMVNPTWLTVKEAADRLGMSRQYVLRLVSSGRIKGCIRGDLWLIDPESFQQYEAIRRPRRKKKQSVDDTNPA